MNEWIEKEIAITMIIIDCLTEIVFSARQRALTVYVFSVSGEVCKNHFFQQQDQLLLDAFLLKNYLHQKEKRQDQLVMFHLLPLMTNSEDYWD